MTAEITAWDAKPATAEEAFETFLRLSVADGAASKKTIRNYRAGFALFLGWCAEVRVDPKTATYQDLQLYRQYLLATGYKRGTIALHLCAMRTLYTALDRWGVRPDNPAEGLSAPKEGETGASMVLRTALSPEQAGKFLTALPTSWAPQDIRDATICRLMVFHGLRVSEVAALDADCVDYSSFTTLNVLGKGAKKRTVVLCGSTRKDLIDWIQAANHPAKVDRPLAETVPSFDPMKSAPLFFRFDRSGYYRLSTRSIELIVDKYLKKAGLKVRGRSAHALRHTCAVLSKLGGATDVTLAQAFGHADLKTSYTYTAAAAQFQDNPAEAVERALVEAG